MQWQFVLALVLGIPIIVFPTAFILYLTIGGMYAAIKERKLKVFERIVRAMRIGLSVIIPVAIYGLLIWFFFKNIGWQAALGLALALPIVLFVPVLIWAAVTSGLYQVARETMRRRVIAPRGRRA